MITLGIETSCDETGAAIVEDGTKIISNVVASSRQLHEKTGGIIPEVAAREQVKCIIPVIQEALVTTAKVEDWKLEVGNGNPTSHFSLLTSEIDAIAVTAGPGLIGSLLVGVETAKTIAFITRKPLIPVNHVTAHIYANFLNSSHQSRHRQKTKKGSLWNTYRSNNTYYYSESFQMTIQFPAISLIASGGHTELFLMESVRKLKWLGGTLDDAAGETFDKTARLLGLGFPGGPAIAAEAAKIKDQRSKIKVNLPRPMLDEDNFNFSFSGLKTAVLREVNKLKSIQQFNHLTIQQLSFETQEVITDVLVQKTLKTAKQYRAKSILLGGGVAANKRLKEKFQSQITNYQLPITLHVPPSHLCTDNAAYVASFAYFNYKPTPWQNIQAQPDLEVEV